MTINAQVYELANLLSHIRMEDREAEVIDNKIRELLISLKKQDDELEEVIKTLEILRGDKDEKDV